MCMRFKKGIYFEVWPHTNSPIRKPLPVIEILNCHYMRARKALQFSIKDDAWVILT